MKKRHITVAALLVVLAAVAWIGIAADRDDAPIPDSEISLRRAGLSEPPLSTPSGRPVAPEPGETGPLPRPYYIAPPRIPHATVDFLPITLQENYCLDCHLVEEREEGGPIPIPASHFIDLRNAPGEKQEMPVGARHNCQLCHVARTDAEPLPGSAPSARSVP